ncbi:MAG: hypothetical protein J4G10_05365 [Alphaproteobacteria bacterium]|nr:hypothetical protein [Alphaproteobacteria bacterium]
MTIPEKFQDPDTGEVRVEALLKSYQALERKLGTMVRLPGDNATEEDLESFRKALGVPASPDAYELEMKSDRMTMDPEINERLFQAGFTPTQAQLVYDLAVEKVLPILENAGAEFEAERETERLKQHFGGEEKWHEISHQLLAWGKAQLPGGVLEALSTTAEGILVMHRMMTEGEPAILRSNGAGTATGEENQLREMMKDPRYWRDHDPDFVSQVSQGFQRLYPESSEA